MQHRNVLSTLAGAPEAERGLVRPPSRLVSTSADRRISSTRATWRFATIDMSKNGWPCAILIEASGSGRYVCPEY
jgi:hypothetical protein